MGLLDNFDGWTSRVVREAKKNAPTDDEAAARREENERIEKERENEAEKKEAKRHWIIRFLRDLAGTIFLYVVFSVADILWFDGRFTRAVRAFFDELLRGVV